MMGQMSFGIPWHGWKKDLCYLQLVSLVLVNDTLNHFLTAQRGLYQGDLLFPSLFVLVGEALKRIVMVARNANLIKGFKPARDVLMVNHLHSLPMNIKAPREPFTLRWVVI